MHSDIQSSASPILQAHLVLDKSSALRQSNAAFTLNRYTQTDNEELVAAQNMVLDAIFSTTTGAVQ